MATATKHERHLYTHAVEQRVIMFRIVFCKRVRYGLEICGVVSNACDNFHLELCELGDNR
jgi:hypothetical protein